MNSGPKAGTIDVRRVVSVSLGSSSRDKSVDVALLGRPFRIERIGMDGDMDRYAATVAELDGKVDAIGVGGINLYLFAGGRRYLLKDAKRLIKGASKTPIVDGSGLKMSLEPETVRLLQNEGIVNFRGAKVLMVCAVDRYGMAAALRDAGAQMLLGDLPFAMAVPVWMRSWAVHQAVAKALLPAVTRLPFEWFYPTGQDEDVIKPKFAEQYRWADVIAGDFLFIRKHLPPPEGRPLAGKVILTNTVTAADAELLRERGARLLVTSSPEMDGRSFATNVMEGVYVTLAGKRTEDMAAEDYLDVARRLGWRPRIQELQGLR